MGVSELHQAWQQQDIPVKYAEWDAEREDAAPLYRKALDDFLAGTTDLSDFRSRIDSLGKTHALWGFRGTGQMFFNQLVKAADLADLHAELMAALPAPADDQDAEAKLDAFLVAVDRYRDRAAATGATKPGRGRINFLVSFFWELQDREEWPTFYPNSRNVLEAEGLLDTSQQQPPLYMAYRSRMMELKAALETNTWGVEHLLWLLGQGAEEPPAEKTATDGAAIEDDRTQTRQKDIYASYRAQGLYFPDEVVTSLVLSLATKRLVMLSGISGTGKTQIALGLARYLERTPVAVSVDFQPPENDANNVFIPLTAPKLQRSRTSLDARVRTSLNERIGLPERGASKHLSARLPDGSTGHLRLNNLGFADESRQLHLLFFLKEVRDWLAHDAQPGDFLHVDLSEDVDADVRLDVIRGPAAELDDASSRYALVAVRSDWTDPRGLLGFFNPLTNTYSRTAAVDLLLRAAEDPEHPYFLILDEMNLSRVEYYFSDFLSAIESDEPINLMSLGVEEELLALGQDGVPAQLRIPANVSFIGTVNVDETTHGFSPKVLDRANVIEFSDVDIERALGHPVDDAAQGLRLRGGTMSPTWLLTDRHAALDSATLAYEVDTFTEALEDVHDLLSRHHLHFGYRVIREVSAFVGHALKKADGTQDMVVRRAFDLQLQQKIIPKLTGGRELELPLTRLLSYCLDGTKPVTPDPSAVMEAALLALDPSDGSATPDAPRFPGSAAKLLRMLSRLADTGFVGALE